jgi:hypothetical protein
MNRAQRRALMKQPLYQVFVTDTEAGHEIPIGFKTDRAEGLYDFAAATNRAIQTKRITGWRDAHVKRIENTVH